MKALRSATIPLSILLSISILAIAASAQAVDLDPAQYYLLSLGSLTTDVQTLAQSATDAGWIVLISPHEELEESQLEGTIFEPLALPPADQSLVVLDGGQFYLRHVGASYTYAVRPVAGAYELAISPHETVTIADVLADVLSELASFGVTGMELDLEMQAYPRNSLKGPAPPEGLQIDSSVYGLVVAEDWFAYAQAKGFLLVGLHIEIVAEFLPDHEIPAEFAPYVIEQTDVLAKLLLPVGQLPLLAASDEIGYVRLPYRPVVP